MLILLVSAGQLFASHGMGGEITWECLGNGQYQFTMKFYRDCNGISAPSSVSLSTNHPIGNIPMPKIASNDISPDGILYNGTGSCATCIQGGNPPIPGLVEEHIYQSAPITLAGVPPAAGWLFEWGTCCRSASIDNLVNPGSQGFQLRAIMYPYNFTNTNPCFDSSPFFAEKPSTIICTGYPYTYNHNAVDPEQDSLVYSWGQPLNDNGAALTFTPGYNINSQLPGPTQNPNNVAVTLDPNTGELNYTSFTGGYYATVLKVTAYKCGIKVAEIFREINVVLNSNCPSTLSGTQNLPPVVNAPFFDPVTGLQTAYQDTVYAGDTVNFFLNATDFDFFQNGGVQTITIEASGNQFGNNFIDPNNGCLIPPCATLTQTVPFSFPIAGGVGFRWVTTCDHVAGINTACFKLSNTYTFVIKATDNYCPANASKYSTISITVLPPPTLDPPTIRCASVNLDGSVDLNWTKSTQIDTQATFHSYDIYASLNAAGPWTLVDSVKTGFNTTSYSHTAASLNTLLGTNAQQQSIFYYIETRSGCTRDSVSVPSNVVQTIDVNATLNANIEAELTWNAFSNPPLTSSNANYLIYKSYPLGTPWVLLDSTSALAYTDTTTKVICDDYVAYRIDLPDSTGCVSMSNIDTLHVVNNTPSVAILPANPVVCQGTSVALTASQSVTYSWSTGATTQTINVNTSGTYTVTVTQAGGCTATNSTVVTVAAPPTPSITGTNVLCQGQSTTFDAGAYVSYLWNTGATTQTIQPVPTGAGTYTVTVTDANGCTGTDTYNLTINNNPTPVISGTFDICAGQNTNLNAGPYTSYAWNNGATTQVINVSTAGPFTVTVTDANGCTGSTSQGVTVNPLPTPVITGVTTICQGQNTTLDAGAGYSTYQWSTGSGNQTINISSTTTVTVTVTDANGCQNTDTESVTVNPNPTPNITGNNVICQGQSTTFDAGAYSSYSWSTGATTQTIQPAATGAGTYTVTVTDANGCTGTDTYNLTINNNPAPVISGNFTICAGQNTNLNAGPYTSYAWSNGATTQVINVSTPGPFNVTVTDANGCTGTASQGVTVNPLPTPNITGVTAICQGQSTTLDAGAGYTTYQWSTGSGAQTINISSTTTVTVTVTDANGCQNTDTESVTVNPNPTPSITGNTTVCQGTSTTLDAGAGYSGYIWSTGATSQTISTGTAGPVTVTVTDVNGCEGSAASSVTVNAIPTASIVGTDSICDGQSSSFSINFGGAPGPFTYSYSDGSTTIGPLTTGSATVNIPVSPTTTTNYNLVALSNANCPGTVSGTALVHVTPLPTATLSGTTDICAGSSTNLSINFTGVAPFTYSYLENGSPVGPFTTNNTSVTIPVTPGSTTTYGLPASVTGAGCAGSTSGNAVVTVNQLPTAAITGNTTICAGSSSSFTLNFTGTGPYTYSYSNGTATFGPFTTSNNPETVNVTPGTTTTYSLLNISDVNCTGSVSGTASVTVNQIPTATISGTTSICDGNTTDLQVLFTGSGPFTYEYTNGTTTFGPFTTSQNPVLIPVTPGSTTTYNLVSLSDINCPGTIAGVAEITVIPLPTATLSGSTAICNGSSATMNITFTGVPPFEYFYTDGTNSFGPILTNNFNTTVTVSPSTTTTYNLTTVTGAGCLGSPAGTVNIVVNELPTATATLTGNGTICEGETSQVTIDFTGTAPFTYEYTDGSSVYGPFTTSNTSESLTVSPVSTTTYSLVSITDVNCPGTVSGTAQVVVNQLPTASIAGNQEICDGSSTSFVINFTGTGPYTYTYSVAGVTQGPFTTSNNPETINVTPTVSTTYEMLTISDANCTGTAAGTIDIVVNEIPTAQISGNSTICYGETTDFNIIFTGEAPFTYTYTDGNTNFGPFTTSDLNNLIPTSPGITSTFTLVSITDANCQGVISGAAQVTVNQLPEPVISGDLSICDGEVTILEATPGFVSYDWSNGSSQPNIVTGTGGIYTVTVTDINGCTGTSPSVNLVVNMVPVVSFVDDTILQCPIPSISFINTSEYDPGSVFVWEFGDGQSSGQTNPVHVYSDPGVYQVTLTITTPAGCVNSHTQPVDVIFFPLADAEFLADPNFTNVFNARVQFLDASVNAVSWYWEFGDGFTSTEKNPVHYYNEVGDFTARLTVTNISGCPDTREHEVTVNPFYIPNAFTPNTDGINDYFFDAGYALDVADFRMLIFNRWGEEVYEADSYSKFWNGLDKDGNQAPQGVYVYKIDVKTRGGKEHTFNGTVTLIR